MPDDGSISGQTGWGPWASGIDAGERKARLRGMRALALGVTWNPDHPLGAALRQAEDGEPESLQAALIELDRLPALTRRRLLNLYGTLVRPPKRRKPEG